ncbi:MAG TPA: cyclic nucleotide-binding domain-containing protein [Candidatus Manganitrophaceae bacterium]|nr:cyclic nucleotide-binding domain-containing protein [Candidatus Manganitrophaceae bacterium]
MTERQPEAQPQTITSTEKILLLKSVDLFREVPIEKLFSLVDSLLIQEYGSGETIVTQGEIGDALFVIVSGKARVEKRSEDGGISPIAEIGEGEAFGEMSILDRETRSATVRALEATRLLSLQGDDFRRLAKEDPEIGLEVAATLSRRLRRA